MPGVLKRIALLMALFGWFISMLTQLYVFHLHYGRWPSQSASWSMMFDLWSVGVTFMYVVIGLVGLLTIVSAVELYLYLMHQRFGRGGQFLVLELTAIRERLPVRVDNPEERRSTEK